MALINTCGYFGVHAAQLVFHIKETQSGHPNLPAELPFIHISLRPPALIHHSSVISHKAMGGSRSQAPAPVASGWLTRGSGNRRGFCLPSPRATSAQLPLSLLPSLNLAPRLVPRLSSSPATYICFPSTRKRNYRPGSRSPERQPEVGSKHMQGKQQIEQLLDLSHTRVMLPPTFLSFPPFSPLHSLPGTLGW